MIKAHHLEIRYPERGRKLIDANIHTVIKMYLEIRYPERGRKQVNNSIEKFKTVTDNLEIRYPERGRKHEDIDFFLDMVNNLFGNKIPREGTETLID